MSHTIIRVKNFLCSLQTCNIITRNFKYTCSNSIRNYASALFIPGSRASETFAFFSPYLDFDTKFADIKTTQEELLKRGMNVNLMELKDAWEMYKTLISKKTTLELNQENILQKLKKLSKLESDDGEHREELEAMKVQLQIIKKDCRTLLECIWEMEEDIIPRCLKLPNKLHEKTPTEIPIVLETFGKVPTFKSEKNHIQIGKNLGLLEYRNSWQYFLFNEAALFEQDVLNLAGRVLKSNEFIRVTGLDFSRSSVVEGNGLNHENPYSAFLIKSNNDEKNDLNPLRLVGNSSLISFLALYVKIKLNPKDLPILHFGTGRQYVPQYTSNECDGIFNVCQESIVQIFSIAKDETQCESVFEKTVDIAKQLYSELSEQYRMVLKPAAELKPWESLRVSFEIWSSYKQQYIEVGHIAMHSDYFSKRLLIVYQTTSGRDFPCIVSGTLISVPKLLGCLLENDVNIFQLQKDAQKYEYT